MLWYNHTCIIIHLHIGTDSQMTNVAHGPFVFYAHGYEPNWAVGFQCIL